MTEPSPLLLVTHGSRDGRSAQALAGLVNHLRRHLPQWQIFSGALQFGDRSLEEEIATIVSETHDQPLTVFPLFLQPGSHVLVDLPQILAQCQPRYFPKSFHILPYLGVCPELRAFLHSQCTAPQQWICVAHGSALPEAQAFFQDLHTHLGTQPAYWHQPPNLAEAIQTLVDRGVTCVGCLPYFLLPGRITDAIAETLRRCQDQYQHVEFCDRPPLAQQEGFSAVMIEILSRISKENLSITTEI